MPIRIGATLINGSFTLVAHRPMRAGCGRIAETRAVGVIDPWTAMVGASRAVKAFLLTHIRAYMPDQKLLEWTR